RGAGVVRAGAARRQGRGADTGRAGVAEDPRRIRGRQAAAHQGPRRAEAERLRQGRRARARPHPGAEARQQEGARAPRRAEEGGWLMDEDLLKQGPREAPEPLTAEERTSRKGVKTAGGGIAAGGTRLYSEADVERLRIIQRLTTELGLNLAGVELVLRLEDELRKAHAQIERLQREAKQEVENVHRHYRRDLVLYREDRLPNRR